MPAHQPGYQRAINKVFFGPAYLATLKPSSQSTFKLMAWNLPVLRCSLIVMEKIYITRVHVENVINLQIIHLALSPTELNVIVWKVRQHISRNYRTIP